MMLEPCKFCGAPAAVPRDDQIEFDSWVASIDCTGCDASLTMQYSCDSPQRAIECISEIWNSKPAASGSTS